MERTESFIRIEGWMRELDIRGAERIVYAVIFGFANSSEKGVCTAGLEYIADWAGVSRMQTIRIIKNLEAKGYIAKENVRSGSTNRCLYRISKTSGETLHSSQSRSNNMLPSDSAIVTNCDVDSNNMLPCHSNNMLPDKIENNTDRIKNSVCNTRTRVGTHTHEKSSFSNHPAENVDEKEKSCAEKKEPKLETDTTYWSFADWKWKHKSDVDEATWHSQIEQVRNLYNDCMGTLIIKYPTFALYETPITAQQYSELRKSPLGKNVVKACEQLNRKPRYANEFPCLRDAIVTFAQNMHAS